MTSTIYVEGTFQGNDQEMFGIINRWEGFGWSVRSIVGTGFGWFLVFERERE